MLTTLPTLKLRLALAPGDTELFVPCYPINPQIHKSTNPIPLAQHLKESDHCPVKPGL
jgi:hypothetical protein